jgi:hypothetical protein
MLQTVDSDDKVVHIPDTSGETLALCLNAITSKEFSKPKWTAAKVALTWCKTYDCSSAAKTILDIAVRDLHHGQLFEAFTLAAGFGDSSSGQSILLRGRKIEAADWHQRVGPRLRVVQASHDWSSALVKTLPASWFLAVVKAEQDATRTHPNSEAMTEAFWATLSAMFIKHLYGPLPVLPQRYAS